MNNNLSSFRNFGIPRLGFPLLCACLFALLASPAGGQSIDPNKWGEVTAPVYGTSEQGAYAGAELFAGPNKFGSYQRAVMFSTTPRDMESPSKTMVRWCVLKERTLERALRRH